MWGKWVRKLFGLSRMFCLLVWVVVLKFFSVMWMRFLNLRKVVMDMFFGFRCLVCLISLSVWLFFLVIWYVLVVLDMRMVFFGFMLMVWLVNVIVWFILFLMRRRRIWYEYVEVLNGLSVWDLVVFFRVWFNVCIFFFGVICMCSNII